MSLQVRDVGSRGFVAFWVRFKDQPDKDWAMEVYQIGDLGKEHWDRFQPGAISYMLTFEELQRTPRQVVAQKCIVYQYRTSIA